MLLLQAEVVASVDAGPKAQIATALTNITVGIAMWDATSLSRELLPEISLHFSRMQARGQVPFHNLHYVLVRSTNEVVAVTEQALESWLMENAGVQRELQVETAVSSIRKVIDSLSQESKKKAYRHLRLLSQELPSS